MGVWANRQGKHMSIKIGMTLLAALSAQAGAQQLDCPRFPEPEAHLEWVAPYMVYNGVPMSVKRFDSELKPENILGFYRRAWSAGHAGPAAVENIVGPWQTISAARGKCFFTVQVQESGKGSTGLLSATQAPERVRVVDPDKALPMMSGSTILNDIEHHDTGKAARTLLLKNGFSAESNADFYRRSLRDQGWTTVSSYQMKTDKGPGITIVMRRGLEEASLVITRSGNSTMVLANLVDRP